MAEIRITLALGSRGYWYWSCHAPVGRLRRSTGTRDRAEAEARIPEIRAVVEAVIEESNAGQTHNPTIVAINRHYLDVTLPNRPAREKTIATAGAMLRDFERFCADSHIGRVQQLNAAVIERYQLHLRGRGKSEKTITNYTITVRAAINAAYESDMVRDKPIRKWRMPRVPKRDVWAPSGDEMRKVLATVRENDPEIWPAIYAVASTGLRPSDAVSLRPAHIDAQSSTLRRTLTKTGEVITIPVSGALLDAIASQRVRSPEWTFVSYRGTPWPLRTLLRRFKAATAALNMPGLNLKSLRHGLARLMAYELGCELADVQAQLGHTKSDTTLTYRPPRVQRSVAEAVAERLR